MTDPAAPECDSCGRPLTDPQSIARRLGPHCWSKEHPAAAPTPGRSDAARAGPGDGQLALAIQEPLPEPLTPHHPPVWRGRRVQTITTRGLT